MAKKNIITQFSVACTGEKSIIDGPKTLGMEVNANADTGVNEILAWLKKQSDTDNNINLTGFSRGAVTLLYIANKLKKRQTDLEEKEDKTPAEKELLEKLAGLKLHIYAIDPVAGITDKSKLEGRIIPSNVASYVAVLQMDEMRRD